MTLKEIGIGQSAMICKVGGEGALRQHFLDMGMDTGSGDNCCEVCTYGRSDGIADSWL